MTIINLIETVSFEQLEEYLKENTRQLQQNDLVKALCKASFYGDMAAVQLLIRYGANVNARNDTSMTPLDCAIENMQLEVIEFLVTNEANVNSRDAFGVTPLHRAVDSEIEEGNALQEFPPSARISSLLLAYHADKNAKDNQGMTPLDWAKQRNHVNAVAMFEAVNY